MKKSKYTYLKDGFEGILYDTESEDDRLLIVIQGLKGLELPEKYAGLFAKKGYSVLAMTYYVHRDFRDTMRAIPLKMFQTAVDHMKEYESREIQKVRDIWQF